MTVTGFCFQYRAVCKRRSAAAMIGVYVLLLALPLAIRGIMIELAPVSFGTFFLLPPGIIAYKMFKLSKPPER